MKTYLAAFALTAALAQPASAITFPSLTTIYVGMGVKDSGNTPTVGFATVFQCANVSGQTATVRFLVLDFDSTVRGSSTRNVPHGANVGVSTHITAFHFENAALAAGTVIIRGTVNIESTQSGVFCQAFLVDASATLPGGVPLDLVRVNPHPGTVE
jgi:hypothetical protein